MALPVTLKTLFRRAKTDDPSRRQEALGTIAARYWEPVCRYLMDLGNTEADAKDLTQDFFRDKVLQSNFVPGYDLTKKFRPYLLSVLDNYVHEEHRAKRTKAKYPAGRKIVSLEGAEGRRWAEPVDRSDPQRSFQVSWASQFVRAALETVQNGLAEKGELTEWEVFKARVADPALLGADPVPFKELCRRHGLSSEKQVKKIVKAVRALYIQALRAGVREYCRSDKEVQEEIKDLIRILSEFGA